MVATTYPRQQPRRSAPRAISWWGKAWHRAVEEAAFHAEDLQAGRRIARAGDVGSLTVSAGEVVAAVAEGDDVRTVTVALPVLDARDVDTWVELVAAESGRVASLLAGDLPHRLVEDAEEAGVELLPYGGELETSCTCEAWAQPCAHALAVLLQLGWLLDADPLVLLLVRGLPRDELLARLHRRSGDPGAGDALVEVALDAALRAARILELLEDDTDPDITHLL